VSAAPDRTRALATALTSLSQIAVLAGVAFMGVLIARRYGTTAETDGFFIANAVNGVLLLVAQSLRTTTVASFVTERTDRRLFERQLGALVVMWLGAAVIVIAILVPGGSLALGGATARVFRAAVVVLLPGAALQLFAGLASGRLAADNAFGAPAIAYAAGTIVSIVAFFPLTSALGVDGVAPALVSGYAVSALTMAVALHRHGWRPHPPVIQGAASRAGRLLLGSTAAIAGQATLVVSVGFASGATVGGATIYSYGVMAVLALNAGLASPVSIVYAPVVARAGTDVAALALRVFRVGAIVAPVAVAGVCLLGQAPAEAVLTRVSDADVHKIFELILILSPTLLAAMLMMVPLVSVLANGRVRGLGVSAAATVTVHLILCAVVRALGLGLEALAAVTLVSTTVQTGAVLWLCFGTRTAAVARAAALLGLTLALPACVAFSAAALLIGGAESLLTGAASFLAGLLLTAIWLRWRQTETLADLAGLLPRPTRRQPT
jgi:hypothetical protein